MGGSEGRPSPSTSSIKGQLHQPGSWPQYKQAPSQSTRRDTPARTTAFILLFNSSKGCSRKEQCKTP